MCDSERELLKGQKEEKMTLFNFQSNNNFAANNTECLSSWTQDNKFHFFLILEDLL